MSKKNALKPSSKKSKPGSNFGEAIISGMEEVRDHVLGVKKLKTKQIVVPDDVNIAELRQRFGLSQSEFANKFGFNVRTLQDWECGRTKPDTAVRFYLQVIDRNPRAVENAIGAATRSH